MLVTVPFLLNQELVQSNSLQFIFRAFADHSAVNFFPGIMSFAVNMSLFSCDCSISMQLLVFIKLLQLLYD